MIKKTLNSIINFFKSYTLIFFGAILFIFYIWLRFIRERKPKDIPFNLTTLGFILLVGLCLVYVYIIFVILFPREANIITQTIIKFLFTPLEDFDYYWKHISWINLNYKKFMDMFTRKLHFFIVKYPIFYFLFYFLPRCILVTTLTIDIFYFNKLVFIYKILLVGVLLFLRCYIIYSVKMYKKDLISFLEQDLALISTSYVFGIHPNEWPENYDPEDSDESEIMGSNTMYLPIEVFVDYYVKEYINNNIIIYSANYHDSFYEKQLRRFNITQHKYFTFSQIDIFQNESRQRVEKLLYLAILLEHYNIFANKNIKVKYMKIFLFLLYLICWSYILIISTTLENLQNTRVLLENIYECSVKYIEEPFSGLFF